MKWATTCSAALLLLFAGSSFACEAYVPCESVQAIHVGTGQKHRANKPVETLYDVLVLADADQSGLKNVHASCPGEVLAIHIGGSIFEVEKGAVGSAGDWFAIEPDTPQEALDAAMSMCPGKVRNHLSPTDEEHTPSLDGENTSTALEEHAPSYEGESASSRCEVFVPCEKVIDISTGERWHEAFGKKIWSVYGLHVRIEQHWHGLRRAYAACPNALVIHLGEGVFEVKKEFVTPDANWFAVAYPTEKQTLDAARSTCPGKVKNYIEHDTAAD